MAIEAAARLMIKYPHSVVAVKDLASGKAVAVDQNYGCSDAHHARDRPRRQRGAAMHLAADAASAHNGGDRLCRRRLLVSRVWGLLFSAKQLFFAAIRLMALTSGGMMAAYKSNTGPH
jgi:hypothetical protein